MRLRVGRDLLLAVRLLSRRGRWLVDDLATELGLVRRSAYRLLTAMRVLGLRVERQREGRCVYLRLPRSEVEDWLWTRPVVSRGRRKRA